MQGPGGRAGQDSHQAGVRGADTPERGDAGREEGAARVGAAGGNAEAVTGWPGGGESEVGGGVPGEQEEAEGEGGGVGG